jgi:hypothetical protein
MMFDTSTVFTWKRTHRPRYHNPRENLIAVCGKWMGRQLGRAVGAIVQLHAINVFVELQGRSEAAQDGRGRRGEQAAHRGGAHAMRAVLGGGMSKNQNFIARQILNFYPQAKASRRGCIALLVGLAIALWLGMPGHAQAAAYGGGNWCWPADGECATPDAACRLYNHIFIKHNVCRIDRLD